MKTRLYIIRMIVTFCLSFIFLTPATVQAQSFLFAADSDLANPQVASWLITAQNFWGVYPNCPQGVTVQTWDNPTPANALAKATVGGCRISISNRWMSNQMRVSSSFHDQVMCNGLVHEYGHLLGHGHVSDAKHIMHDNVQFVVPGCVSDNDKLLTGSPTLVDDYDEDEDQKDNTKNVIGPLPDIDADYWVHNVSSSKPTVKVTISNKDRKNTAKLTVCVPWGKNKVFSNYKRISYSKSSNCYRTHVKARKSKTLTFKSQRRNSSKSVPQLKVFALGEKLIG